MVEWNRDELRVLLFEAVKQRDALLEALEGIDELLSGDLPITAQAKEIIRTAIKELKP